ncbi:hypothetical protein PybrP1_003930 [[Pythium] brassicae (nom. inval.)]|nr:hypothetical protein PybrP1_003930 [[Pythium] brassicae (nom. inval.)]
MQATRAEVERFVKLGELEIDRDSEWASPAFIIMKSNKSFVSALDLLMGYYARACVEQLIGDLSFVQIYLDDVLIVSQTFKEHLEHLGAVFQRLTDASVVINPCKSKFCKADVKSFGFKISEDDIRPVVEKMQAIAKVKPPKARKQLPEDASFQAVKAMIAKQVVFAYPDFPKPFQCTEAQKNYPANKHELLSINVVADALSWLLYNDGADVKAYVQKCRECKLHKDSNGSEFKKDKVRALALEDDDNWNAALSNISYAPRSGHHTMLMASPGELAFGRNVLFEVAFEANWTEQHKAKLVQLKLASAKENDERVDHEYKPDDKMVLSYTGTRAKHSAAHGGPFTVVAVDDDEDAESELQESPPCDAERSRRLEEALGGVARAFAHAGLRVARVSASTLPHVLRYHRVTTQPSLLWLPPRAAKNFQRFPHPETNALDLTAPEKLLAVLQAQQTQQSQSQQRRQRPAAPATTDATPSPEEPLAAVLREVVRQWFIKSGLASARSGVVPAVAKRASSSADDSDSSDNDKALSAAEFVPVVAVLAFLGVVAHNNRELLLKTLRGRFLWFFWSIGVTYAAYSGVFHSLIHNMPLFYYSAHYGLLVFHPSGRRQFALEGLFSGAWSFVASLGAFSVVEVLPMERSRAARAELFLYALVLLGVSGMLLHITFLSKTPWLSS